MLPPLFNKVEKEFTRVNCARLRETLLNISVFGSWSKKSCFAFSHGSEALSAFLESHGRLECACPGHHSRRGV